MAVVVRARVLSAFSVIAVGIVPPVQLIDDIVQHLIGDITSLERQRLQQREKRTQVGQGRQVRVLLLQLHVAVAVAQVGFTADGELTLLSVQVPHYMLWYVAVLHG